MGRNLEKDDPKILANFGKEIVEIGEKATTEVRKKILDENKPLFPKKTIEKAKNRQQTEKQGFEPGE